MSISFMRNQELARLLFFVKFLTPHSSLSERKTCKTYLLTTEPKKWEPKLFTIMASDNRHLSIFYVYIFIFTI